LQERNKTANILVVSGVSLLGEDIAMTAEERNMLADLADKIAQTAVPPKDSEAEDFIRSRIGSRPDALYLMTQTVLIQNLALQRAQEQIQELQQRSQTAPPASGGSFLGQSAPRASSGYGPPYASPSPAPPQYAAPSPSGPSPSGAGSFLRGAAQTAAGVAAGALAFEGISSLFSHQGYGGGFGSGGLMGAPVEEVVNNYYDSPAGEQRGDQFADPANAGYQDSNQDDNAQYDDADYDSSDDSGSNDDSGDSFA
jgi:hypothetical protein